MGGIAVRIQIGKKEKNRAQNIGRESSLRQREYCVLCHEDTGYTADVPIEKRQYYYEGCGQLCLDCYRKIQEEQQLQWDGPKAEHCTVWK